MSFMESIQYSPFTRRHIKGGNTIYMSLTQCFPNLSVHWVLLLFDINRHPSALVLRNRCQEMLTHSGRISSAVWSLVQRQAFCFSPQDCHTRGVIVIATDCHCIFTSALCLHGRQSSTASPAAGTCLWATHIASTLETQSVFSSAKSLAAISQLFLSEKNYKFGIPLKR